jgi:hypothetical protein
MQTGAAVSADRDLGAGWRCIAAIRSGKSLKLFVNGNLVASTESATPPIDASCEAPLQIGFGTQSYFHGKIRDVRLYNRALGDADIRQLANNGNQPAATATNSAPQSE